MRQNLAEWEASLKPYFGHIMLLGEIPITHVDLEQLGILIRDLVKRCGPTKATRKFEAEYPRTFALFLASIAAFNTERNYWRVVSEATGASEQKMVQQRWGSIFLGVLEEYKLPSFSDVGEANTQYYPERKWLNKVRIVPTMAKNQKVRLENGLKVDNLM